MAGYVTRVSTHTLAHAGMAGCIPDCYRNLTGSDPGANKNLSHQQKPGTLVLPDMLPSAQHIHRGRRQLSKTTVSKESLYLKEVYLKEVESTCILQGGF